MAQKPKFTRIPKVTELVSSGVPAEAVATYCCLADHANNKTGLCWPTMERMSQILNRSVRTVQRHLHLLKELGLIEFVERRRYKGKFSSYLYKICFIATTGHGRPVAGRRSIRKGTKQLRTTPKSPQNPLKDGYYWLFGDDPPPGEQAAHDQQVQNRREEESKRRREGFEWFFGK